MILYVNMARSCTWNVMLYSAENKPLLIRFFKLDFFLAFEWGNAENFSPLKSVVWKLLTKASCILISVQFTSILSNASVWASKIRISLKEAFMFVVFVYLNKLYLMQTLIINSWELFQNFLVTDPQQDRVEFSFKWMLSRSDFITHHTVELLGWVVSKDGNN